MKRHYTYKHPTTYAEIVEFEHQRHKRRLLELKRAEKMIRAVAPELTTLSSLGLHFCVGEYSMHLVDCRRADDTHGRSKWALRINAGIFNSNGDRLTQGFLSLGWIMESVDRKWRQAVLRRPKTQMRLMLDVTDEYAKSLQPKEAIA